MQYIISHHAYQPSTAYNDIQHQMHCSIFNWVWLQDKYSLSDDDQNWSKYIKVNDNGHIDDGDDLQFVFESDDEMEQLPPPN